jgi:hypothetical protein
VIYRVTRKDGDQWIPLDGRGVPSAKNVRHYSHRPTADGVVTKLTNESKRYDVEDDHVVSQKEFRVEQCEENWTPA